MVPHRTLLAALLAFCLFLSFILSAAPPSNLTYLASVTPPFALLGLLAGGVLSFLCATWIRSHHLEGVVSARKGWFILIIVGYFGIDLAVRLYNHFKMPYNLCVLLGATSEIQCAVGHWILTISTDVAFVGSLLLWGILYEMQIGHRLIYRFPQSEKEE